ESAQETVMNLADMLREVFVVESTLLRVLKGAGEAGEAGLPGDILRVALADAMDRLHHHGREAITAFAEGDEQRMLLIGLRRFTKLPPFNTTAARRRLAAKLIEENKYCF